MFAFAGLMVSLALFSFLVLVGYFICSCMAVGCWCYSEGSSLLAVFSVLGRLSLVSI
jgi:hypothetical protein